MLEYVTELYCLLMKMRGSDEENEKSSGNAWLWLNQCSAIHERARSEPLVELGWTSLTYSATKRITIGIGDCGFLSSKGRQ